MLSYVMMKPSVPFWIFIISLFISEYQCQLGLGLFDSFLDNGAQQSSSLVPLQSGLSLSAFNQNPRPQNFATNNGRPTVNLDKEKLQQQKEQLEDLLAKLQEMNRLKEEQRQKEQGLTQNVNNKPNVTSKPNLNNHVTTPKPRPIEATTKKPEVRIWKKLMTKKFVFQAQPVVPEDQVSHYNKDQFVYYIQQ